MSSVRPRPLAHQKYGKRFIAKNHRFEKPFGTIKPMSLTLKK